MRKLCFLLFMLIPIVGMSQNENAKRTENKTEYLQSNGNTFVKFYDITTLGIPTAFGGWVETNIRVFQNNQTYTYSYVIKDKTSSVLIKYSDLVDINNALDKLQNEVNTDIQANRDYLENKYVSNDGFQIGYCVKNGETSWFMQLNRNTSSFILLKEPELFIPSFKTAQQKIEELKSKN